MNSHKSHKHSDIFEMVVSPSQDQAFAQPVSDKQDQEWHVDHQEGQLAIDVFEAEKQVVIVTTMAGAMTDRIEVFVHNHDLLTIRGERKSPVAEKKKLDPVHQECFWGKFSRTIVLPADVYGGKSKAEYKNGVLTVIIPKQEQGRIPIEVVEE
jgi:HSP20 family protein